jgi:benzoyl-CoA reductase/2-hydroxyglutaryl-CoA dehydratase subunit BcrC/BadD/HgdB
MLYNPVNMPQTWSEKWVVKIVEDFNVDGIVLLSSRSCKATSIGNMAIQKFLREKYGIPSVVIEADHTDDRAYSNAQAKAKLDTFMEILGSK